MSRALTYWDDATVELIREHFVAVSVPTWVCRAEGPEGEFLRGAGIDRHWVTSSGYMNCVSAGGELLGRRASREVLEAFSKLPEEKRTPGAVAVPELPAAERTIPPPPEGGLVLRVHARFLSGDGRGGLRHATPADFPLMRDLPKVRERWKLFLEPNTECLWLTGAEWRSLVPPHPEEGQRFSVDLDIPLRMARFHFNPKRATTSEGGIVRKKAVKTAQLEGVVEAVSPRAVSIRLEGRVHWGSDYDEAKATTPGGPLPLGFEAPLHGRLEFDREAGVFTRFDLVAPGHVWGRWGDANNKSMYVERPGREPFGFAIELADGSSPTDRIPPGGNGRYVTGQTGYFSALPPIAQPR